MTNFDSNTTEQQLIAYHLGELSRWQQWKLRRRMERDAALAAESEEIAATLRMFAADATVAPGPEVSDRAWQRVRSSMLVLEQQPTPHRGKFWTGVLAGSLGAAVATSAVLLRVLHTAPPPVETAVVQPAVAKNWSTSILRELHMRHPVKQFNGKPGPLTVEPVDVVADNPELAAHLDTAERVLTEVSHTEGALPSQTRAQVHYLLLNNATYHQAAESHGDHATAAVIDDLGRVLISLDAEPAKSAPADDSVRLQMNLGSVLLDLRILHHNSAPRAE